MSHQELLELFRTAYQNLQLLPLLTQEEFDKFRVEYSTEVIDELEQRVEDSPSNSKIVFTGHTGCGKSTLLAEFGQRLKDRHFVVSFSIADMIEMSDVNHVNILFAIAVQLMEAAEDRKVRISPSIKKKFYQWFSKHTKTETTGFEKEVEIGGEAGAGINLADIFKFLAAIKAKLKANEVIREEIKTEFARKISDLIDRINEIAIAIAAGCGKPILVIIDDLDKLDLELVESIYRNNIEPLFQPQFRIIYTIPISAIRNVELRAIIKQKTGDIEIMRVSKFFKKEEIYLPGATPDERLMSVFQDILHKRVAPELIQPETARQIALKSGGVLREMIRLASQCCAKCLVQIRREMRQSGAGDRPLNITIDAAILQQALTDFQVSFAEPLGRKDYELLGQIEQQPEPEDMESDRFLKLLHGLYVLEYRNAKLWYALHPIVRDLLQSRNSSV